LTLRLTSSPPRLRHSLVAMERVQTLVVGAGVVGLACARALARSGREVVVVEAAGSIGMGTSSRNSEVVHAGIYYPEGSLKARHCVRGAAQLLDFCRERGVAHRVCGKLIVATSESQHGDLAKVAEHARRNGVHLRPISREEARELEPEVECTSALHSPGTAIVDSHGFMEALLADAQAAGAALALRTRVRLGGRLLPGGGVVVEAASDCGGEERPFQLLAQEVINCAGLSAPRVARALGLPAGEVPVAHFCKGNYYALQGAGRPFNGLVYPVPEKNTSGLGVHATVDLAGQVRFGPDVQWLPSEAPDGAPAPDEAAYGGCTESTAALYGVDVRRAEGFYEAVRRYWPGLPDGSLAADYSGIRAKLSAPGEPASDFVVAAHRPGPRMRSSVVSLFGIESPGLTSSLSLADEVLWRLGETPE